MDNIKNHAELQLQIHLAEYTSLRNEILYLIKWKDSFVFISLAISGSLFTFAFYPQAEATEYISIRRIALYLIAPLAALVGLMWIVNSLRMRRISDYIKEVTVARLQNLLGQQLQNEHLQKINILEWESSSQSLKYKWERRFAESFIYLTTFAFSGILAQIMLLYNSSGDICDQILELQFPFLFITNCFFILIILIAFLYILFKGLYYQPKTSLILPN